MSDWWCDSDHGEVAAIEDDENELNIRTGGNSCPIIIYKDDLSNKLCVKYMCNENGNQR